MKASGRAGLAAVLAAVTGTGGCARLVVVDRDTAHRLNDSAWTARRPPPPTATVAPSDLVIAKADEDNDGDAPTAAVAAAPGPVVPIRPGEGRGAAPVIPPEALRSPTDEYGVPRDLYRHDPLLAAQADIMATRVSSHRKVGAGTIALGCAMGALSAFLLWRASVNAAAAQRARDNGQEVTSDPSAQQAIWGIADGVLALGLFVYGIADLGTSADPTALQRYYRETYGTQ